MKKLSIFVTSVILLISASSFAANPLTVPSKIKVAFEKTFLDASNVNWTSTDGFFFAYFNLNDQKIGAAYNEDGELVATSRVTTLSQLPLSVSLALQSAYKDYNLSNSVEEVAANGSTNYYIIATNNKNVVRIKADANGYLSVDKKVKNK